MRLLQLPPHPQSVRKLRFRYPRALKRGDKAILISRVKQQSNFMAESLVFPCCSYVGLPSASATLLFSNHISDVRLLILIFFLSHR